MRTLRDGWLTPTPSRWKEVNTALHAGNTGPRHQNVETKYEGPNGEMIDVSQVGWVGTRGLD